MNGSAVERSQVRAEERIIGLGVTLYTLTVRSSVHLTQEGLDGFDRKWVGADDPAHDDRHQASPVT